jgi:hypothetical protein
MNRGGQQRAKRVEVVFAASGKSRASQEQMALPTRASLSLA